MGFRKTPMKSIPGQENIQEQAEPESFALSFAQERLWILNQVTRGGVYNIAGAVWLEGDLDELCLERCLREIVRRHEILRTSFAEVEGSPVQRVHEEVSLSVILTDLCRAGAGDASEEAIQRELRVEASKGFDLSVPGLLRARLFRVSACRRVLLLVVHHIVADGWSIQVLIRELEQLYEAYKTGVESPLPELEIQYVDYAAWHREQFSSSAMQGGLAYWKRHLAGAPAHLDLPVDYGRPGDAGDCGALVRFVLTKQVSRKLRELSVQNEVTLYTLLLAAWQLVLWRFTGQKDVISGSPVSERQNIQTENLIGLFVNLVPLRSQIEPEMSFAAFLQQVKQTLIDAQRFQHVPFEKIVDQVSGGRERLHMPLVQTVLAWQPDFTESVRLGAATGKIEPVETGTSKFDLTVMMRKRDAELEGEIEYRTNLFAPATVERIARCFVVVLERMTAASCRRIAELISLEAGEQSQLKAWNETRSDYPREETVVSLFEQVARTRATSIALVSDQGELTYGELNSRANQLAWRLRGLGVGPEVRVGICLERSLDTIISILGTLKAGGVYVPLDPNYPPARLELMVRHADAKVVLTRAALRKRLPDQLGTVMLLDQEQEVRWQELQGPPATEPESLAYVMYTSGSTGTPKGVAVTHRNVVRLVRNTSYVNVREDDVFLQFAPISFDAATFEIWGALLNGARLALAPAENLSVEGMGAAINRFGVTTLWLTAGLFHLMAEECLDAFRGVRHLLAGGDVLRTGIVKELLRELPSCRLTNGYGPTEGTTFSCCCHLNNCTDLERSVPIGFPISNSTAYVLDELMDLAPIGVAGELYIGGDGLARGYLNRPDLTAEKFLPDSVSGLSGARLYRSGDRARYLDNGSLEFLGRIDDQVKIRGYRVELEEVENALAAHPAVRRCAVTMREDAPGNRILLAYVVAEPGLENRDGDELRNHLKNMLPEYMLPSAFVFVESLPLSANGKLERRALPLRPPGADRTAAEFHTATETAIANIWQSLLAVEDIQSDDNFFALGGNSLLAAQMISRLRRRLGTEIPIRLAFESATLRDLASAAAKLNPGLGQNNCPLVKRERRGGQPASFGQERIWFMDQMSGGTGSYNIAGAVTLHEDIDPVILEESLKQIIARHEILRTSFAFESGQLLQRAHQAVRFAVGRQTIREGPDSPAVEEALRNEATRAFDLGEPGLIRATLLELTGRHNVLLLALHHIIADGWSIGVLIQELNQIYKALWSGNPSPLAELPLQYGDYAAWQRDLFASSEMQKGLEYWKKQLQDAPTVVNLPANRTPPPKRDGRGSKIDFTLGKDLSAQIEKFARERETTAHSVVLAVFQALLSFCTGQSDLLIGSPVAGRQHGETECLIGPFVNLVALRARVDQEKTFLELLSRVKTTTAEALEYQHIPFEKVVEVVDNARALPEMPLVQAVFAWQSGLFHSLELGNASGQFAAIDTRTTKFDLTLGMWADQQGEIRGIAEYAATLFDAETIQRIISYFVTLLQSAISRSASPLCMLDYMTAAERKQMLSWGKGPRIALGAVSVLQMFERCRTRHPDHIAVEAGGSRVTWQELDWQSNQLAHHFQRSGVTAGSVVGICMERSAQTVTAMLAALKAGAAYLILDSSYPAARLKYMTEDADVSVLCGTKALLNQFQEDHRSRILLDIAAKAIDAESCAPLQTNPCEEELAYLNYTSGSTGLPKGVQITHRGLRNLVSWHERTFRLSSQDRTSQIAGMSFDASTWEIWSALTTGATLCLAPEEARHSPAELCRWLAAERITVSFVPTPLTEELITLDWPGDSALRFLLTGGDRLRVAAGKQLPFVLVNNYGPTECSVVTTSGPVITDNNGDDSPSIGRAIDNIQVYVLDRYMRPVPPGIAGELFVAGEGLARGYNRQPDLTAERFVPDPFSAEGERMYRTGDMVSYLPEGRLKFLGRKDNQVKLRGHRIELHEIASVLRRAEGVRDAVVTLRPGPGNPESTRLVAYLAAETTIDLEQIRRHVRRHLPHYMEPSVFVVLGTLPLTSNGKIDVRALPEPQPENRSEQRGTSFAATPSEELIASVWSELLGVESIQPDSNFFELGGHSLVVAQMILRLRQLFRCELPLQLGFELRTLKELAAAVDAVCQRENATAMPPQQGCNQSVAARGD